MAKKNGLLTKVRPATPRDVETEVAEYLPRTPLGKELIEIRKRILASGQPLLETLEDLEREVAERRGGYFGEPR